MASFYECSLFLEPFLHRTSEIGFKSRFCHFFLQSESDNFAKAIAFAYWLFWRFTRESLGSSLSSSKVAVSVLTLPSCLFFEFKT